jgi:hypothetical protein
MFVIKYILSDFMFSIVNLLKSIDILKKSDNLIEVCLPKNLF